MSPDDKALVIAEQIADGSGVNWPDAEVQSTDPVDGAMLAELKAIAALATLHRRTAGDLDDAHAPAGSRWGPLTFLAPVAAGQFGQVYRAWDARLQRQVALKLIHAPSSAASGDSTRAIDEARLLARVRDPNVLTVHGAECLDGQIGIWTEFIEGRTLEAILTERGPLPAEDVVAIGIALCRALAAVHEAGLLHRDIKTTNVMRETGGRIVLMDFGTGHDVNLVTTRSGDLTGTPLYLAPELFTGGRPTVASDVYALAVLLFRLLTNEYPVPGRTLDDVRAGHREGRAECLRKLRPDVPSAFLEAIECGLATDPVRRHATPQDFETALGSTVASPAAGLSSSGSWLGRRGVATVLIAASVLMMALVGWQWVAHRAPTLPLTSRKFVLVGAFENRTGEALFDGAIADSMARELGDSHVARIIPRRRVDDVLRLMKKPVDSVLDPALAREVSQRDGEVGAVVTGAIERVGSQYRVAARIVSPESGERLADVFETAVSQATVAGALRRLSNDVRAKLGEQQATIDLDMRNFEHVTTPSLLALRIYTEAVAFADRGDWPRSLELAQLAVTEDAGFAAARTWLAWSLRNTGRPDEALDTARLAASHIDGTSEWERLWILGSLHSMTGERDQAVAEYEKLLQLRPDHFWALNNLALLSPSAADYAERLGDLLPNNYRANMQAAKVLRRSEAPDSRVDKYWHRAFALVSPELDSFADVTWVLTYPARRRLAAHDPAGATAELEQAMADSRLGASAYETTRGSAVVSYLAMGQVEVSRQLLEGGRAWQLESTRRLQLALLDLVSDRAPADLSNLAVGSSFAVGNKAATTSNWPLAIWVMVRQGDLASAERVLRQIEALPDGRPLLRDKGGRPAILVGRADLALAQGQVDRAIEILNEALPQIRVSVRAWFAARPAEHFLRGSMILADAWVRKGSPDQAAASLRLALDLYGDVFPDENSYDGLFAVMARFRLAALYRHLGRAPQANAVEKQLSAALALADPSFVERMRVIAESGLGGRH